MKLQFDAQQAYQLAAVEAVVDLFDGQPLNQGDYEISLAITGHDLLSSQVQTELGIGNKLVIDREALLKNLRRVQERNDLEIDPALLPELRYDEPRVCPLNFSVEMETGTGKTYVYLRTIFELNRKYGFKKFIIVVPSVAIREGVLKNLEITQDHFKALYNHVPSEHFVYDAKKVNRLRQFAVSNQIQILVINIDAFRKNFTGTQEERKSNVIYKENDKLSGRQPIEYVRATHPLVIIDEPQSVDSTEKAQEAIRSLNPLCTLRYSATHKNPYNLVYSLDPIRAFELGLVKQIVVASVTGEGAQNDAYVKLLTVDRKNGIKAKVEIDVQTEEGPKRKAVTVKNEADLFVVSKERENYREGYLITEINGEPGHEYIQFNSGKTLVIGEELGGIREDLWKAQIKTTVRRHLDKEVALKGRGIKVLSLFFIDKVGNYRSYNEQGQPVSGKFAETFEAAFAELIAQPKYKEALPFPVEKLHNGYFAQDKKGVFKDTNGNTLADDDVYNLIMRDMERLLSLEEPLRFIFSHSALREGWDSPNVFQICTLNETKSVTKKRQEIGRGLRLPVNQQGERVADENINKLLVVANESYEVFARKLQTEYEEDCGVTFGKVPPLAFAKLARVVGEEEKIVGRDTSQEIFNLLVTRGMLSAEGKILPAFDPKAPGFNLGLPPQYAELRSNIIEVLQSYQLERHIKKEEDGKKLVFKKGIELDEDFKELWHRISPQTTYSVEYKTQVLVANAVKAIQHMEKIKAVQVHISEAEIEVARGGLSTLVLRESSNAVVFCGALPDVIAYLQSETELTRATIVCILQESKRLHEFLINPQKFMDAVAAILKHQLHKLMIDGIKYERIEGEEFEMRRFETDEILSYLHNRLEVNKSIYDAVVYDSEVEREFAVKLEGREDVKLFVKLPDWFKIETPLGTYNPDWAILKHDDSVLYLVRETKSTKNFEKLRGIESEKIRCGRKHFESLKVDFDVVTSAREV
jgi:type III restriction enzyme